MSSEAKNRTLLACIGDDDTITGMLLAGIGQVTKEPGKERNFKMCTDDTSSDELLSAFQDYTSRNDIAILLINQHLADKIRIEIDSFTDPFPAILEIPSKDHPYDPEKDSVLRKVRRLFGDS